VAGTAPASGRLGRSHSLDGGRLDLDSPAIPELLLSWEIEFSITFDPRIDLTPDALRTIGSLAGPVRRACAARISGPPVEQIRRDPEAGARGSGTALTAPEPGQ